MLNTKVPTGNVGSVYTVSICYLRHPYGSLFELFLFSDE